MVPCSTKGPLAILSGFIVPMGKSSHPFSTRELTFSVSLSPRTMSFWGVMSRLRMPHLAYLWSVIAI